MRTAVKVGTNIYRVGHGEWMFIRLDSGKMTAFQSDELVFSPNGTWTVQIAMQHPDFERGMWAGEWRPI